MTNKDTVRNRNHFLDLEAYKMDYKSVVSFLCLNKGDLNDCTFLQRKEFNPTSSHSSIIKVS